MARRLERAHIGERSAVREERGRGRRGHGPLGAQRVARERRGERRAEEQVEGVPQVGEVDARRGEIQGGVRVKQIVEDQSTTPATYDPGHPKANEEGFVYLSNVNPMNELVEMTAAARSFESNIEAMNTAKQLMMRTVELLKK